MATFKSPKYSVTQTQAITVSALAVLADSPTPLTIEEIKAGDLTLTYQTTQKMARVLNELVEAGFVKKTKSKSRGKMIYAAVANLEEQGYSMEGFVC